MSKVTVMQSDSETEEDRMTKESLLSSLIFNKNPHQTKAGAQRDA
jgi:hypothetical protein